VTIAKLSTEPKVTKKVYTINSTFNNSECVKINIVWNGIPNNNYTLGEKNENEYMMKDGVWEVYTYTHVSKLS